MLVVTSPDHCLAEARYAIDIVLGEYLGVAFSLRGGEGNQFRIEYEDRLITVESSFLLALKERRTNDLTESSPKVWDSREVYCGMGLVEPLIPVLFGDPSLKQYDRHIYIGIDIFGAAFFMLSRYEETQNCTRDQHGRFPVKQSMAYRHGFLMRPIVDEYIEILWAAMQRLWPGLKRKERTFEVVPTHDVDWPWLGPEIRGIKGLVRRVGGDVLVRKAPMLAAKTIASFVHSRFPGNPTPPYDPFNVYDRFMDLSEREGVRSRFYFMTRREPAHFHGGNYDVDDPRIIGLMKHIVARGHEIGIHPTGESYIDSAVLSGQADSLRKTMEHAGLHQDTIGGRQHYLRWKAETTPGLWEVAGLDYDSTLGYPEHVGFRCGTCHSFPLWDFTRREPTSVIEHPLILMEGSMLRQQYMGLDTESAHVTVHKLKNAVRKVNGRFVFLWHNSSLLSDFDRALYEHCLAG